MFTLLIYQIDDDNKTTLEHQNYTLYGAEVIEVT